MYKNDALLHLVWTVATCSKERGKESSVTPEEAAYLKLIRKTENITIDWSDFNAKRKELGSLEIIIDEACKALRGCGKEWRIKCVGYMKRMAWVSWEGAYIDDHPNLQDAFRSTSLEKQNISDAEWKLILRAQKELGLTDDERNNAHEDLVRIKKSVLILGKIYAFWNPTYKCFIKMTSNGLSLSPKKEDGILPSNWVAERFLAVNSAHNMVALWNPTYKCFIKMTSNGLSLSPKKEDGILPYNWDAERFRLIEI